MLTLQLSSTCQLKTFLLPFGRLGQLSHGQGSTWSSILELHLTILATSHAVLTQMREPAESFIHAMDGIVRSTLIHLVEDNKSLAHSTVAHMNATRQLMVDAVNDYCDACKAAAKLEMHSLLSLHAIIRSKTGELQVCTSVSWNRSWKNTLGPNCQNLKGLLSHIPYKDNTPHSILLCLDELDNFAVQRIEEGLLQ